MSDMFAGEDLSATKTKLIERPEIPADLAARMKALSITFVGMRWNEYHKYWSIDVRGPFGPREQITTLNKTMTGLVKLVEAMEQKP